MLGKVKGKVGVLCHQSLALAVGLRAVKYAGAEDSIFKGFPENWTLPNSDGHIVFTLPAWCEIIVCTCRYSLLS